MNLEVLTMADYDEVRALWEATPGVGLNECDERAPLALFLERNPHLSLILREGSRIVGAVLCGHDGRRGYLHHLAVAETHRGQGGGRLLVETCLKNLAERGILKGNIFLYTHNEPGRRFWKHLGWKPRTELEVWQILTDPVAR